jgi:hypothetical protein
VQNQEKEPSASSCRLISDKSSQLYTTMKYYPIQKNWRKARDIYSSPEAKEIWYPNMILLKEMKVVEVTRTVPLE